MPSSESNRDVRTWVATRPLAHDHWRGSESNKPFTTWTSELFNTTFAGDLQTVTDTAYLDIATIMTAIQFNGVTSALFNYTLVADAASWTFANLFAAIAKGVDKYNQSPILEKTGNNPPSLDMWPKGQVAEYRKWPLWTGIVVMILFCVSVPILSPQRKWRMPKNVQYPANVVSIIYDSSLIEI